MEECIKNSEQHRPTYVRKQGQVWKCGGEGHTLAIATCVCFDSNKLKSQWEVKVHETGHNREISAGPYWLHW